MENNNNNEPVYGIPIFTNTKNGYKLKKCAYPRCKTLLPEDIPVCFIHKCSEPHCSNLCLFTEGRCWTCHYNTTIRDKHNR